MIAAVALNKNFSKIIFSRAFIIIFNIRLEHRFRKIIILIDNDSEGNFIFQRFVKENDLINDLIKYIKKFINGYAITIYRKHDLITYIKNLENQNQTNIVNFLAINIKRYDIFLG
jgi:5S rRNA maturation endonuclease (ribonuclease M5)